MPKFRYTAEMLDFIEEGYKAMRIPELTEAFNREFGLQKTPAQIRCTISNHSFTCGRPTGTPKGQLRIFTNEQMAFIRKHYGKLGRQAVADALNQEFGTQFTYRQITAFIKNHRLYSDRTGYFRKGHAPHNKGVKGWRSGGRSVETQFKKGRPPEQTFNYVPIGSTRITRDGYIERKVTDDPSLVPARRWVAEHRLLWAAANGPIPKGHVVVFLDGDKQNLALDNLRCVPRGVLQYMNKVGLHQTTGEARKAAILTAEVVTKTKQLERKRA